MKDRKAAGDSFPVTRAFAPAAPLWQLAPTRGADGRCLADFMMLIPGLGSRPVLSRERAVSAIREVCESYGEQVAFADINYALNVLWVSVVAEPRLAGRVAQSIRERVPGALLIGGHLGSAGPPATRPRTGQWRWRPRSLIRLGLRRLGGLAR